MEREIYIYIYIAILMRMTKNNCLIFLSIIRVYFSNTKTFVLHNNNTSNF